MSRQERNVRRQQAAEEGIFIYQPQLPIVCNQLGDPRYSEGYVRVWDPLLGEWIPEEEEADFAPFVEASNLVS